MSRSVFAASTSLLLGLGFAAAAPAQKGIAEPRVGLEFKPPKGWMELPADGDRHATMRLYCAPRALSAAKGEALHTPLMRVMFFKKGGDPTKDVVDGLPRMTPFRSLEDFAQRGLGARDVSHENGKVGAAEGLRVTGKNIPGGRVLYGQTFGLDDGEAAVCFEVANEQFEKLKKDFEATFASLAAVAHAAGTRIDAPWVVDAEWSKKDANTRASTRRKWADDVVAATAKAPEEGFKVQKTKYWIVLSSADPDFTKKAITAAETMRAWCQQKMPELTKEAPLPAVLRIFQSPDHLQAFLTTGTDNRDYDQHRRELFFANDKNLGGLNAFGQLFRAVLWQVFDDVDPGVLPAMPRWLDNGIWEFMRSSHFDGKKLEFVQSDVEKGRMEYDLKHQDTPPLWGLIQEKSQVSPEDGANEKDWGYTPECARLMRWLWLHDGQKAFDKPNMLSDYVKALGTAYGKLGANPIIDVSLIHLPENEQKELQKEVNKRHYKWRDAMLVGTNDVGLPLSAETWKAINDKWLEFVKTFKG